MLYILVIYSREDEKMYQSKKERFSPKRYSPRGFNSPEGQFSPEESPKSITAHGSIAVWANNSGNFEEMISELDKNYLKWVGDSKKFYENNPERYQTIESKKSLEKRLEKCQEVNIVEIIKKLSKYKQVDVLEYILRDERFIPLIERYKNQIKTNSKALSELVWINERNAHKSKEYIEKIKQIFILLMNFGFNFLQPESYGGKLKETLVDSLISTDNKMEEVSKQNLYNFFTKEWFDNDKFLNEIDGITCRLSNNSQDENIKLYKERLVFLISRNLDSSLEKLFIMFMRKTNKFDIVYLMDIILSPIRESCFDKYFEEINFSDLVNNIYIYFIENYKNLVKLYVEKYMIENNSCTNIHSSSYKEFVNECYVKSYKRADFILAQFYNHGFKQQVLLKLKDNKDIKRNDNDMITFSINELIPMYIEFISSVNCLDSCDFSKLVNMPFEKELFLFVYEQLLESSISCKKKVEICIGNKFKIEKQKYGLISEDLQTLCEKSNKSFKTVKSVVKPSISYKQILEKEESKLEIEIDDFDYIPPEPSEDENKICKKICGYYNESKYNDYNDDLFCQFKFIKDNKKHFEEQTDDIFYGSENISEEIKMMAFIRSFENLTLKNIPGLEFLIAFIHINIIKDFKRKLFEKLEENNIKMLLECFDNPIIDKIIKKIKNQII